MIKRKLCVVLSVFAALLMLGACGDALENRHAKSDDADRFRADPKNATAFFYVAYDTPEDEPFFGETYRFLLDGGYIGEIDKQRYVALKIPPGEHTVTVDELDWGGNVTNLPTNSMKTPVNKDLLDRATLKRQFKPGEMIFIMERISAGQRPFLSVIDGPQGMKAITLRKRECMC